MANRRSFLISAGAALAAPAFFVPGAAKACDFVSFTAYNPPPPPSGGGGGGGGGALGGCSLRPGSIEGLNPEFRERIAELILAANMEVGGQMRVYSAYRSIAHQRELWEAEIRRTGSAEVARITVAPPGRSMHQFGLAVDLGWNTCATGIRYEHQPISGWMSANLARFGLIRPLSNEGWHVEPIGGRVIRDQMIAGMRGDGPLPPPPTGAAGIPDYGSVNASSSSCEEILRDLPMAGLMPWGGIDEMTAD